MKKTLKWRIAQFMEIRWWRNYLKKKDIDTYLTWKLNYWKGFLRSVPESVLKSAHSVLDAGCGPAGIFMALPEYTVSALDPLLDAYQKHLPHFQPERYPWVKFHNGPMEQYPEGECFDCIFAINSFNHFSDLTAALHLFHKHLNTGGYAVITIDAHKHTFLKHLFQLIPGDILHPHQYTLQEYENLVKNTLPDWQHITSVTLEGGRVFNYDMMVWKKA